MFHILVVDDDKHTRKLLRAVLENAHYTVTTATNGNQRRRSAGGSGQRAY